MSDTSTAPASGGAVPGDDEGAERIGSGAYEEEIRRYVRSPEDVLRLVVFGAISVVVTALTIGVEDSVLGFEEDVLELFDFLTPSSVRVIQGSLEIAVALIGVTLYAIPIVTRRFRVLGYLVVASLTTLALMSLLDAFIDRQTSEVLVNRLSLRAGIDDNAGAGVVGIAQMAALFIVTRPFVSTRWRRAGLVVVAVVVLGSLLVTTHLPVDLFLALPVGAFVGAAVLLAFGRPDRRPTLRAIRTALDAAGLPVTEIHPASVDARGSTPYFGTLADGTGLFAKVLSPQERAADLLFRLYRYLRFKDVGDDRPFSSLRRTVEHEALVALLARDIGVRTPRFRGVVDVGGDSMLLAYEMIDGRSLDGLPDEEVSDELMTAVWEQVGLLRRHRIAHRDLRRANVFVAADGAAWLIDFGFSEVAVDDGILDADVAQLLASFVVVAGAERAVRAAVDALGPEAVAGALPRLQLRALSGATQTALKDHKGLLDELQQEVMRQCGLERADFAQLERLNRKTLITAGALVAATYFLYPQLSDLPGIGRQVRDANWGWAPLIAAGSALTYVAASISLSGAVPQRLAAGPMFVASVGSSFTSKIAPAGIGGMALNVRFLQKQGVDEPVAVSSVGLNTIAGFVGHISLIGVFIVWAGRDAFDSFTLPDPKWFLLGAGIALGLAALGVAIPWTRQILVGKVWPIVARAFDGLGTVLRSPLKLTMLLGGSTLVTFAYILTLHFSVQAFGGGLPFATVGAIYLVGAAVAQAAPTPGGLGAIEAAFIGGLTAAGLDNTVAVPAVFLYRLFTFWVPILPGWIAFQWMERNDYI